MRAAVRVRRRLLVRLAGRVSFTSDVSRGGLCLGLMNVLPSGTAVAGTVRLEGRELPFAGRVAWARAGDRHLGLAGRMGVQLIGPAAPGWPAPPATALGGAMRIVHLQQTQPNGLLSPACGDWGPMDTGWTDEPDEATCERCREVALARHLAAGSAGRPQARVTTTSR